MGAVILVAIQRAVGRELSQRELFHSVLRLEQALTTGGGWQDQIGGAIEGVKMIVADAGLVPDARVHYVPPDVLDPKSNGGLSLLYYTGVTRLAKDILHQVVGRYLSRDRATMATLKRIRSVATEVAEAFTRKDAVRFGRLVDVAWRLNKQLDPNSSNEEIEALFERVGPFIHGAKLLGAGGGGFMLMICRSQADAMSVHRMLEAEPPNNRARFFNFEVSREGLTVTVC
jgi:galactokinase/mevalonate kinase-like predicted kinase